MLSGVSSAQRQAAFFDLDKTIIAKSSALAFGKHFFAGGLISRRGVIKSTYAQLVFMGNGADEDQIEKVRRHLTQLVAGWDVSQVRSIVAETLHDVVAPIVYEEATTLIAEHKAAGRDVVVVSASGSEVVEPIAGMLGADHVVATRIAVEDGKYTGEIDFYAYGPNKAVAMREMATKHGYALAQCYAYSDSITDLPMLEAVGHPAVVNPDRELKSIAIEHDWPVLRFSHGVSLQERLDRLAAPKPVVLSTAAIGAAAAIAGLAWFSAKKWRVSHPSGTA